MHRTRIPLMVLAAAAAASTGGCTGTAQAPAGIGAMTATRVSTSPTAVRTTIPSAAPSWVAAPSSIAMPKDITFAWTSTPSGNTQVDQAVEVVEDINRAEIAGIGASPADPNIIDFNRYATGQTLAWINAEFADYRQTGSDGATWFGTVSYTHVSASEFTGAGPGQSGVVQYCVNGTAMTDKLRSNGQTIPEGASNYVLATVKLARVSGGWQATNFSTVAQDAAACAH